MCCVNLQNDTGEKFEKAACWFHSEKTLNYLIIRKTTKKALPTDYQRQAQLIALN